MTVNPKDVVCPACNAQPGMNCTNATPDGRRAVLWLHFSREGVARELNYQATVRVACRSCSYSDLMCRTATQNGAIKCCPDCDHRPQS